MNLSNTISTLNIQSKATTKTFHSTIGVRIHFSLLYNFIDRNIQKTTEQTLMNVNVWIARDFHQLCVLCMYNNHTECEEIERNGPKIERNIDLLFGESIRGVSECVCVCMFMLDILLSGGSTKRAIKSLSIYTYTSRWIKGHFHDAI